MELTLKSTPEKYKKMVVKLLPPLLKLLQKLTFLEEEIYERNKELDAEKGYSRYLRIRSIPNGRN